MTAIAAGAAAGELTPGGAFDMARVGDSVLRVIDGRDAERQAEAARCRRAEREAAEEAAPRHELPRLAPRPFQERRVTHDSPVD
jgi:hypothetical protein